MQESSSIEEISSGETRGTTQFKEMTERIRYEKKNCSTTIGMSNKCRG